MKTLLLTLAIVNGADSASTCLALKAGLVERNPILPSSCAANVAINGSVTAGTLLLVRELHTRSPKLATGLTIGLVGSRGFVVGWNFGLWDKARERQR